MEMLDTVVANTRDAISDASRMLRTTLMSSSSSSSAGVVAVETQSSSCTWRQRRNEDGRCELQPRSCFSCLNTIPTSQESCTLTPDGVCMGADAYDATRDYRRDGPSSAWPPHLNFFSAVNATYCEADDVACASCRERSFKNWQSNPSQYCEGVRGCVCVSVCENDLWESTIQPTLQKVLMSANANSSYANCTIQAVTTQGATPTATAIGNRSDFVGLSPTKAIFAGADQCMWIQNQTYCGAPRSCFDCLNTPLYSGVKCMLHSSGYCTSMASYDATKDFRRGRDGNATSVALFPSINTTYCATSDPTCLQCRQNHSFAQWTSVTSPPQFCIGANDCVCLASCESPLWQRAVVDLTCNTSAIQQMITGGNMYQLSPIAFWSISAASLLGAMMCALVGLTCLRRCHRSPVQRRRPRSPRGPTLELSGWKAMREKLIETEREFVGETGTVATHLDSRLHAASTDGADPEMEPSSESLPLPEPMVVVEEGDAYRPISPSRMRL